VQREDRQKRQIFIYFVCRSTVGEDETLYLKSQYDLPRGEDATFLLRALSCWWWHYCIGRLQPPRRLLMASLGGGDHCSPEQGDHACKQRVKELGINFNREERSDGSSRRIVCDDAIEWLKGHQDNSLQGHVFTSIPDVSELNFLSSKIEGKKEEEEESRQKRRIQRYKEWFIDVATLILQKLPQNAFAIFYQSDVRVLDNQSHVLEWIDKSHLCHVAADRANVQLKWHKLCSLTEHPFEKRSVGRPAYSHLLCYGKGKKSSFESSLHPVPDIFWRGDMIWPKAIGLHAALLGCGFLARVNPTLSEKNGGTIIDPFCGFGTICAVANVLELDAVGIEISEKRCRKARHLSVDDYYSQLSKRTKSLLGATLTRVKEETNKKTETAITIATATFSDSSLCENPI